MGNPYFNHMNLPKPMSKDEEEQCLADIRNGNPEARNQLVERNIRLVVHIANKFNNLKIEVDELFSIGCIGLIKAAKTFNPGKDIKFATYAGSCINNEILMVARSLKSGTTISFDEPIDVDPNGNGLYLSDVIGINDEIIEKNEDKEVLYFALKGLNQKERHVLECRYGMKTGEVVLQDELSKIMGLSQSYISRLERWALAHLRKNFNRLVNENIVIRKGAKKVMEVGKMTGLDIKRMAAEGKTVDEIFQHYKPRYEGTKETMVKAKIAYLMGETKREPKEDKPIVKVEDSHTETEIQPRIVERKSCLKAVRWRGKQFEYDECVTGCLMVRDVSAGVEMAVKDIEAMILELQEIQSKRAI